MDSNKRKTILIVEDEVPIRKILADVLQKHNFSVLEATNGKGGVDQALGKHPDLILLDILLPVMDGMKALREIRKDTWGANVPVIILTNLSATSEELVKNMVIDRPVYYLIKSDWEIQDVIDKIEEVLNI